MIYGIGIDITEINRIKQAVNRNRNFTKKILTVAESSYFDKLPEPRCWEYLAGRFSAKESYAKAYGTGLGRVGLHDIEILNNEVGKPVIERHPFDGSAFVSISHTASLVMTEVILEKNEKSL